MKSILPIMLLGLALLVHVPASAGSKADDPPRQSSAWRKVWSDFKDDWVKIGKGAKESGAEVGRSIKEEAVKMPDNFRKGWQDAKDDFQNGTPSPNESRSDH